MIFRSKACAIARSSQPVSAQAVSAQTVSTRLLLSTLLGFIAIGGTAQTASANPLQAVPIVGDLIRSTRPAPQLPTNLDIFHDNVQGNHVNVCALTCGPSPIPGARQGAARSSQAQGAARSSQAQGAARSSQAQGAVRSSQAQGAARSSQAQGAVRPPQTQGVPRATSEPRPTSNRSASQRPAVTVNMPPINIPL